MSFTFSIQPRDFKSLPYALYRVRQISGDKRENPPFSYSDEEWVETLEDTKVNGVYQVFTAVLQAISTDPTRLQALSEASGSYTFTNLDAVKISLQGQQTALNRNLGLGVSQANNSITSVPLWVVR